MLCTDNKPSLIPRFLALVAVAALGLLTIVGSSKEEQAILRAIQEGRPIDVSYILDTPDLFFFRDGVDGELTGSVPTGNHTVNVTDPDGFFEIGVVCMVRGVRMGYYFKTTADETPKFTYLCDNTDVETTSNFSGTINLGVNAFFLHIGTQFPGLLPGGLPYNFPYMQDADEPQERDVLLQYSTTGFPGDHFRWFRSVQLLLNILLNHTFNAADLGDQVNVDVSGPFADPDSTYIGTDVAVITQNQTRANVGGDDSNPNFIVVVPPQNQGQQGDITTITMRAINPNIDKAHTQYWISPMNLIFNEIANDLPTDTVTENAELTVNWDTPWNDGITGQDITLVGATFSSAAIDWGMFTTKNRFNGTMVAWFPKDAFAGLTGVDPSWVPSGADHDTTFGITSNGTVQDVIEAREGLSTDHDQLFFTTVVRF